MEAEEKDLSVGVVCTKKDEEPGPCGSAAHFLLGMDMEGDPPVTEMVEGDALMAVSADLCFKTKYSNQCQFSCPINVAAAVNDDQVDAGFAVDDDSYIGSTAAVDDAHVGLGISLRTRLRPTPNNMANIPSERFAVGEDLLAANNMANIPSERFAVGEDLLAAAADVDIAVDNVQDLLAADVDIAVDNNFEAIAPVRKKMPKRKHKFGKGAKRGGDRKSCRHVLPTALVHCTAIALVDPTALVARERPTPIPVKQMNKKQLHRSLHCTTKKLVCAKKKDVTTSKKLTASEAQCTILTKLAQDRPKESNLAHQKATSEVNAIRAEAEKSIHFAESEIALRPPLPLGFPVGLGDNDNIDDNPTPSAGHTIHTQQ